MKSFAAALIVGAMAAGPALAQSVEQLAKDKQCMSCHAVDKEVVGPSFKDIAARYQKVKNAKALLVQSVLKGTDGKTGYHWGTKPMPSPGARVTLTPDEAQSLVDYVLAAK